jgi:hypothetical protein
MQFTDLDSDDSGRDESGFMHRLIKRHKVGAWSFQYGSLTQAEYSYMLSILPQGGTFTFTYPDPADPSQSKATTAYLSQYGITWHNARTGLYRNFKFDIIEC